MRAWPRWDGPRAGACCACSRGARPPRARPTCSPRSCVLTVDLARLGLRRGDWLLDAGCGGGRHCFGALDRGAHVVGLDLDVPSLRIARAGIHERRGKATVTKLHGGVLQGDVFRLPFGDATFDRVICSEVM